jgi:hypothetical protein
MEMEGNLEDREIELEDGSKEIRKVKVSENGEVTIYNDDGNGVDNYEMTRPKDPEYLKVFRLALEAEKVRGYDFRMAACMQPKGWCAMGFAGSLSHVSTTKPPTFSYFAMSYGDAAVFIKRVIDSGIDFNETTRLEHTRYLEVCRLVEDAIGYGFPREVFPCSEPKGWCILMYDNSDGISYGRWDTWDYPTLFAMSYERVAAFMEPIFDRNRKWREEQETIVRMRTAHRAQLDAEAAVVS